MAAEPPGILTGAILAHRLFQAAYEIDLGAAERALARISHRMIGPARY